MIYDWPTQWREHLLEDLGIPVTQFAVDMLGAWERSTPTRPWTHNPFGLPPNPPRVPQSLNPLYGAYVSLSAFTQDLKRLLSRYPGSEVVSALTMTNNAAGVWRAVSGMNLPAAKTETEYPVQILDTIPNLYTTDLDIKASRRRKSGGQGAPAMIPSQSVDMHSRAAEKLAPSARRAARAIDDAMRGWNSHG